jgi:hypothetical protein
MWGVVLIVGLRSTDAFERVDLKSASERHDSPQGRTATSSLLFQSPTRSHAFTQFRVPTCLVILGLPLLLIGLHFVLAPGIGEELWPFDFVSHLEVQWQALLS